MVWVGMRVNLTQALVVPDMHVILPVPRFIMRQVEEVHQMDIVQVFPSHPLEEPVVVVRVVEVMPLVTVVAVVVATVEVVMVVTVATGSSSSCV